MRRPHVPEDILSSAHARSRARRERDWVEADRLKAEIEAAGWRVVDRGADFHLEPAEPLDEERDGALRYGTSRSVPSRLEEPADPAPSVVVLLDGSAAATSIITAIRSPAPAGTTIVAVGDDPDIWRAAGLEAQQGVDLVLTRADMGLAARINAGIRRSAGSVVIVVAERLKLDADVVAPLIAALDDPGVAVAGGWGSRTKDLRHFEPASGTAHGTAHGTVDGTVDVIDLACIAFRRGDVSTIGLLDEGYRTAPYLGAWLSLALCLDGGAARRAVVIPIAATRPATHPSSGDLAIPEIDEVAARRRDRRDYYRLRGAFAGRIAEASGNRP